MRPIKKNLKDNKKSSIQRLVVAIDVRPQPVKFVATNKR